MSLPIPHHTAPSDSNTWASSPSIHHDTVWHDEDLIDHHLEFHDLTRHQGPGEDIHKNEQEGSEAGPSKWRENRIKYFTGTGRTDDRNTMEDKTTGGPSPLVPPTRTEQPINFPNPAPPALTSFSSSSSTSTSSSQSSNPTQSHPANPGQPSSVDDQRDDLMCRICFGSSSPEEIEELGRLISPCLCSGSMSHVHGEAWFHILERNRFIHMSNDSGLCVEIVKCINQWRGTGRNKKAFHECTQCHFRYRFHRTLIFGLASSPLILLTTSLFLFLLLTLFSGELLLNLLSSRWFDHYIRSPFSRIEDQLENDTTAAWTGYGFSGGMVDIVVRAVNVFMSGEAEEVVMKGVKKVVDVASPAVPVNPSSFFSSWSKTMSSLPRPHIPSFIKPIIQPLLTRFSLGFSLIGALSFVSLLISSSLLGPFQMMNNIRVGRGGGIFGWTRRRRAEDGVGVGSVIVVVAVCMGAISTIKQLYALTTDISHFILLKAETAILEVNPKGEVLAFQPVLQEGREVKERWGVDIADGLDDDFAVADD